MNNELIEEFETWLAEVDKCLARMNMRRKEWNELWYISFDEMFRAQLTPANAAIRANRFWWKHQNKAIRQSCRKHPDACWLPAGHRAYEDACYDVDGNKLED